MKKSLIALSVLALVTILGAGSVFAGPDGHRGKGGPGMMGSRHHGFGPLGRLALGRLPGGCRFGELPPGLELLPQ